MIKHITDKKDYIKKCDVENFEIKEETYNRHIKLFGHDVYVNDDPWLWHLHLKLTDTCNAKCKFCVEQGCPINENADDFLNSVDKMLNEMNKNDNLFSVSLTGGEPLLFKKFPELIDLLKQYPIKFLTMNTNGVLLPKNRDLVDGVLDFVDISRHAIDDTENNQIFKSKMLTKEELKELKKQLLETKMRIQCVMSNVRTVDDMNRFLEEFSFADDISFRRLMTLPDEYGVTYDRCEDNYDQILDYAYHNFDFVEQTIQDYYVYEIWNNGKTNITFSYSNMDMLRKEEHKENDSIFREFIIHPDGLVAGSWKKDHKILYKAR